MSVVSEIITQDQIQDLWGCGFTIVARARHPDPFYVPSDMVPQGRSYQWWHLVHDKFHFHREGDSSSGWAPVPASRHDGYFMPFGHVGDIEVNGLGLFEKSKVEVDQERAGQIKAAQKPLEDWAERNKEFSGGARLVEDYGHGNKKVSTIMPSEEVVFKTEITEAVETIDRPKERIVEVVTKVPADMFPHMSAIFAERDRLKDEVVMPDRSLKRGAIADKFYAAVDADKSLPWWPTLHAILLPIAIENVRKSLKQESGS